MRFRRRQWRRTRRGTVRLRPAPVLREPVTYDLFERVCLVLGLDPDAAFSGTASLHEMPEPRMDQAEQLLSLILVNARAYDLRRMEPARVKALVSLLVNEFFFISDAQMPRSRLIPLS